MAFWVVCTTGRALEQTTFSVSGRHNIKILGLPGFGSSGYSPVPYDFDYTGLVNAYYAVPNEKLGIKSVRERYYLGPCRPDDAYVAAIEHINQFREEIFQFITDFVFLDMKEKRDMISYLEEYFNLAAKNSTLVYALRRTCY